MITAAKRYVHECDPKCDSWVGSNRLPFEAAAGYRALLLLSHEEPAFLDELSQTIWACWAPLALTYHDPGEQSEGVRRLFGGIYAKAPDAVLETLSTLLTAGTIPSFVLDDIEIVWDDRVADRLMGMIQGAEPSQDFFSSVLAALLRHRVLGARDLAANAVKLRIAGEPFRSKATSAASDLLRYADDCGWGLVWPTILNDHEFGLEVFARIASIGGEGQVALSKRLTEDQLTELYIWLLKYVPQERTLGFGAVSGVQSLQWWRESIVGELKSRATPEACDGIRRVIAELPEFEFLKFHLVEAEEMAHRKLWVPLTPHQLLAKILEFEKTIDDRPWLEQKWDRIKRRPVVYAVLVVFAVLVWFKDARDAIAEPFSWISRRLVTVPDGSRIPGGTGWVLLGEYDPNQHRWVIQPPYELVRSVNHGVVPSAGDEVKLTTELEVMILGYSKTGVNRHFEPPGLKPVRRDVDYSGTTLPMGTTVQVLDVSRSETEGTVWVRVSVLPRGDQG